MYIIRKYCVMESFSTCKNITTGNAIVNSTIKQFFDKAILLKTFITY